ncbi:MAG: DNA-processing protein DprA [Candidatus Pacebacteria bacterium]|nr:DNA-processing protein DprA [Candidatus Paceibacterota bacterium]MCF7857264.1 DNA-processing protein DprA [Candidatus Paceibacterota bacterium]
MDYPIQKLTVDEFPPLLCEIPKPPKELYLKGTLPPQGTSCLAVVGSRNYTNYGKQVVEYLISGLRGYPISIISGLALGIDSLAHTAALSTGLHTLAVPGSGIDDTVIYPRRNLTLAQQILGQGGGLLSEFEPTFRATPWSFPQRNRIMAGLSHAVLLIEASERSGTLITARLTADYNRELLVVPGNIFSENSAGSHQFLKLGATPVTTPEDILIALNIDEKIETQTQNQLFTEEELTILNLLSEPKDSDTIIRLFPSSPQETVTLLMHMELNGLITEQNGVFYRTT